LQNQPYAAQPNTFNPANPPASNNTSTSNAAQRNSARQQRPRQHHHPHVPPQTQPDNFSSPKPVASPWGMNAAAAGMPAPEINNAPVPYSSAPVPQSAVPFPVGTPAVPQSALPFNPLNSGPPSNSSVNNNNNTHNNNNNGNLNNLNTALPAENNNAPKVSTPTGAKNTPPASGNGGNLMSGPTTGIVGNLRKGIIGWFYPDAHDATENIGKSLEAYYDDKLGRWIFPGEVRTHDEAVLYFIFELISLSMV
ncbi:MAG: hypothetical protein K2Q09_09075, partial [Phycisphaerales bacterium]|nr:hypothetical protein [Phycisphaerales bacterium]